MNNVTDLVINEIEDCGSLLESLKQIQVIIKTDIKLIRHDNRPAHFDKIVLNDLVRVKKRLELIIG